VNFENIQKHLKTFDNSLKTDENTDQKWSITSGEGIPLLSLIAVRVGRNHDVKRTENNLLKNNLL
jgi:hypothetical protein